MWGNVIGDELIWVGVFIGWEVGDKFGVGSYGIWNDIVIVWLFNRVFIVLVILFKWFMKDVNYDNVFIVEVVKVVFNDFK